VNDQTESVDTGRKTSPLPSRGDLRRAHEALLANEDRLQFWLDRGVTEKVLKTCNVGWHAPTARYWIPIHDASGALVNVKRYKPGAKNKSLHWPGHGRPNRLLGAQTLAKRSAGEVLVCAGEPDWLLARSLGFLAVTATSGEGAGFTPEMVAALAGRDVVLVLDTDEAGRKGASKLSAALVGRASSVRDVVLPLPAEVDKDLTDWVKPGRDAAQLRAIVAETPVVGGPATDAVSRVEPAALVRRAIEEKIPELGSRNGAGFWLACQLRDGLLEKPDAWPVMQAFQRQVMDLKTDPYTEHEARDSLDSAYSRPPRSASAGAGYELSDAGNAERLVDRHGTDMCWVAGYGGWHYWTGKCWAPDHHGQVMGWAKETARSIHREAAGLDQKAAAVLHSFAKTSSNAGRLKAMLDVATSEPGLSLSADRFDADPDRLVAGNCAVEVRAGTVTAVSHAREHLARVVAGADYDPRATAPAWDAFLGAALPDKDVRDFVQRLVGYSLIGGNPERRLVFVIGPSSTGKSTFLDVLDDVLGGYSGVFNLDLFRSKPNEGPRPRGSAKSVSRGEDEVDGPARVSSLMS